MDIGKILTELKEERSQIEQAILALERLASGRGKRRGRPPAWLKEALGDIQKPPAKPVKSIQRKKIEPAMRVADRPEG